MGSEFNCPHRTPMLRKPVLRLTAMSLLAWVTVAQAQLVAPVNPDATPAVVDPMERAKRQADNVMRWIKVQADKDKPRAAPAAPAPKPAEPAPKAKPTAPAPATAAAPPPVTPAPVAPTVLEPAPAVAPVVAPTPAPAAVVQTPVAPPPPPPPPPEEEEIPLKAISQTLPDIPRNIRSTLTSGKVMVRFTVETNGTVTDVEVLNTTSRLLNKSTIATVQTWKFEPIKAPRVAQVEINFSL